MEDLDVNTSIWGIFMTATLRAAVHLGIDNVENLHSTQNQSKRTLKQFDGKVDQGSEWNPRYIRDQMEATNLTKDNFAQ